MFYFYCIQVSPCLIKHTTKAAKYAYNAASIIEINRTFIVIRVYSILFIYDTISHKKSTTDLATSSGSRFIKFKCCDWYFSLVVLLFDRLIQLTIATNHDAFTGARTY